MASRRKSNSAEAAGEQYAQDQINSEYFSDWVRDQLREASKLPEDQVLPLETKADALVVAGKMLQQLEWDTKREYRPEVDDAKAFFVGFHKACQDARPWLADELLEMKGEMGLGEARRKPEPNPPGAAHGLEWHRYKEGFVGTVDGERRFLLDPTADGDWVLWHVNTKTGFQDRKLGRFNTAADAKDAARLGSVRETPRVAAPTKKRDRRKDQYEYAMDLRRGDILLGPDDKEYPVMSDPVEAPNGNVRIDLMINGEVAPRYYYSEQSVPIKRRPGGTRETPRVASRKSPKAKRSAARRRRGKDGRFR